MRNVAPAARERRVSKILSVERRRVLEEYTVDIGAALDAIEGISNKGEACRLDAD